MQALDLGGLSRVSEEALVRVVRTNSNLTLLNFTKCSLVGSDLVCYLHPPHPTPRHNISMQVYWV
jgi:hypothetical protein